MSTTATKPPEIKPRIVPPAPPKHRRWWQTAGETAALIVVGIFGLEIILNACGVGMEEILQPDPQMGMRHIPDKRVVWRMEGFSNDKLNSAGLRDIEHTIAKPANVFRIALLGDSATEGLQVPLSDTYGRLLQDLIKVKGKKTEVINFGCSSYSTGQEVLQFEREVAQYKPDLTLLLYNRGDAIENVRKPADLKGEPRPYFYLDGQGALQQDNAVLDANEKALEPNPTMDNLRRNSRLYGVFSHANLTLSLNEPLYRKLRGWVQTPFKAPKPKHSEAISAQYGEQNAWRVTSALISRLNRDCENAGSKLLVVTFPNVVRDAEFGGQIEDVQKLAQKEGFSVFDLTPSFNWYPDPKSLFIKYHFSSMGHKRVAEKIGEYLDGHKSLITAPSANRQTY